MDLMWRRRVMLAAGKRSRLPREYQEVEYLVCDGRQFFHIDGLSISNIGFDVKYLISSRPGKWFPALISSRNNNDVAFIPRTANFILLNLNGSVNRIYSVSYGSNLNTIYDFAGNAQEQKIISNGVYIQDAIVGTTVITNIYFLVNITESLTTSRNDSMLRGRIYHVRIYADNALIYDFIPCYQKQNRQAGMFEITTQKFYPSEGTGEFLVGPDVN